MQQTIVINDKQKATLTQIIQAGTRVQLGKGGVDKRAAVALFNRGLVKISENTKGEFVRATAKGKKFASTLN